METLPMHRCCMATVMASLLAFQVAVAGDWGQFRGPTGQGTADAQGVPLHWTATDQVEWKVELPGQGWSSPVIVSDRLYLTTAVPQGVVADDAATIGADKRVSKENAARSTGKKKANEGKKGAVQLPYSLRTLCLDVQTGATIWETEVFHQDAAAPKIQSKNSHASPTPLVAGDAIYVHFGHLGTACLDLDGRIVWRNASIQYKPVHGNGGTPVLADGKIFFSVDGSQQAFVVALDAATGDELWRFDRESVANKKFSFCTPTVIDVSGRRQLISPGSDAVHALDPDNGSLLWKVTYDGYSVVPKPVYDGKYVFVCTGFDSPSLLAIRPDGSGDVTESHVAWIKKQAVPKTPSLILADEKLFMISDNGIGTCLNAESGELVWRERIGGEFSASPILAEGHIYLTNEDGKTTIIKADDKFEIVSENPVNERVLASLAVDDGVIILRSDKHLYRIKASGN